MDVSPPGYEMYDTAVNVDRSVLHACMHAWILVYNVVNIYTQGRQTVGYVLLGSK